VANEVDRWIQHEIGPFLRDHGFTGGPRRFRRRVPGFLMGIQFQGSTGNVLGALRFTINYGVRHERIAAMTGNERRDDWLLNWRISDRRGDVWYDLARASDASVLASVVLRALEREVLPAIVRAATPEGFRERLESLPKPWGDEALRQLDAAERYDASADRRTAQQRRRDAMLAQPAVQQWLSDHPEMAEFVDVTAEGPTAARAWAMSHELPGD
jgi:hypothetical protein